MKALMKTATDVCCLETPVPVLQEPGQVLIRVLRALGRADWLSSLSPTVSISPMQMLKVKPVRRRASRKH